MLAVAQGFRAEGLGFVASPCGSMLELRQLSKASTGFSEIRIPTSEDCCCEWDASRLLTRDHQGCRLAA